MFFACGIWCLADISSVSPSSEPAVFSMFFFKKQFFSRLVFQLLYHSLQVLAILTVMLRHRHSLLDVLVDVPKLGSRWLKGKETTNISDNVVLFVFLTTLRVMRAKM